MAKTVFSLPNPAETGDRLRPESSPASPASLAGQSPGICAFTLYLSRLPRNLECYTPTVEAVLPIVGSRIKRCLFMVSGKFSYIWSHESTWCFSCAPATHHCHPYTAVIRAYVHLIHRSLSFSAQPLLVRPPCVLVARPFSDRLRIPFQTWRVKLG